LWETNLSLFLPISLIAPDIGDEKLRFHTLVHGPPASGISFASYDPNYDMQKSLVLLMFRLPFFMVRLVKPLLF
jgi:hypothetical protein